MKTISEKIRFVKNAFGPSSIARDGKNIAVICPACEIDGVDGRKKKLSINLETWQFHCWVCGIKGKTVENIIKKYIDFDLAQQFSIEFLGKNLSKDTEGAEVTSVSLPDDFIFLADSFNSKDPDIKACINYIYKRGLKDRDFWYFKFGTSRSGDHRRRVIIPSFDEFGDLNYFSSRAVDKTTIPKYLNSKADKTSIIFNEININWKDELTIVEGPFDLVKCNSNATCLLGSSLSEKSLLFKRIIANNTPVLLALDADMSSKADRYAKILSEYCCNVRMINIDGSSDVGDMLKKDFLRKRENATQWNRTSSLMRKIEKIQSGSSL
tara:strand:- start:20870 stop:21841 length:972 start_codon:yes stop_codon:yes gene_type:complete